MNRNAIVLFTAAAAAMVSNPASAVPTGAHWAPIDNCTNPVTGELTGLGGLWKTYDLYIDLEPGDVVVAIDFGITGFNSGISTDGVFYQTPPPFGSDSVIQNESFAAFSATASFDTAVAMNDEPLSFADAMDWNPAGATGAWFSSNQNQVSGPLFVARLTVPLNSLFLGGQVFVSGSGPNGDFGQGADDIALGVVDVFNIGLLEYPFQDCVPAPGVAVVIAMGLFPISRRNRQQEEPR